MYRVYAQEALEGFDDTLELVQTIDKEETGAKLGEFDVLHDEVSDSVEAEKTAAEDATDDAPSDDAPSEDAPVEDTPSDEDVPEDNTRTDDETATPDNPEEDAEANAKPDDASSDKKPPEAKESDSEAKDDDMSDADGKRSTVASEMLRNEFYERTVLESVEMADVRHVAGQVASGAFELAKTGVSKGLVVGGFAASMLWKFSLVLKDLGVAYSPVVARTLKKGVIYLFMRSVRVLLKTSFAIVDFTKRHVRAISKRQKEIQKLRETLAVIKTKETPTSVEGRGLADRKTISWLSSSGSTEPIKSASVMKAFMEEAIKQIDAGVFSDLTTVKKLIDLSESGFRGDPVSFLRVTPFTGGYLKRGVRNYQKDPDLVESVVYHLPLPDGILFAANLPRSDLKEIETISKAYQESGVFLAVDASQRTLPEKMNYMDVEGVERFLDVLEQLCTSAQAHTSFYARLKKEADGLKFGFRHYYQKLVEDAEQATVRTSLVEYVYLKQAFVGKVYLPAAMDVHDYVSAYLVRALRFAKDNVKALS